MANPFDYIGPLADIPSASDSFTKGIMTAEALDTIRKKNAAEKMALDQQVQMQSDLGLLYQNPTISGINRVMARYPAMADKFKPLMESMTEQQKTARIQQANNVFMPLLHGDRATAIEQLKLNETAAKNSGDEASAQSLGMMRKLVESTETGKAGDNMVLASVGSFLSAAMGDKEFAKTYEALEKARREQEMAPSALSKAESEAALLARKVMSKPAPETLETATGIMKWDPEKGEYTPTGLTPFVRPGVNINVGGKSDDGKIPMAERPKYEADLRKEYYTNTKTYQDVKDSYERILSAESSAAGDIALIYGYMKMLDPGSVVREGEFATAQNASGIPTRIQNLYNKALKGERLAEDQRKQFMTQAGQIFKAAGKKEKVVRKGITRTADSYGLNPQNIFYEDVESEPAPLQEAVKGSAPGQPTQQRNITVDW